MNQLSALAQLLVATAILADANTAPLQLGPGFHLSGQVYFTTGARGGLLAIGMTDGKTLWETHRQARILGVYGNAPLAVVPCEGKLCIARFQARGGREIWQSPPLPLPDFAPAAASMLEAATPLGSIYLHDTPPASTAIRYVGAEDGPLLFHLACRSKYWKGVPPRPGDPVGQRHFAEIQLDPETGALTVLSQQSHTLLHGQPSPADPWQKSVPQLLASIPASWQDPSGIRYQVTAGDRLDDKQGCCDRQQITLRAVGPTGSLLWDRALAPIVTRKFPVPQ
ncbi:MAG: hypothetical protein JNL98_12685 [Bryobacterales bacterium]|nr:hypothetical protein [Bryobacterales bacterium]